MSAAHGMADFCTPLQALLRTAPLTDSVGADFKKGTWTFKLPAGQQVASGQYVVVPAILARLALDNEAARANQGVHLPPFENARGHFFTVGDGQIVLSISDSNGCEHNLYRDYQPTEQTAAYWQPSHWRGHESRKDATGKEWRSMARYVQNDFGDLVQVSS